MTTEEFDKELKDAVESNKVKYGFKETLDEIRTGNAKKVVIASNIPEDMKKEIEDYAKIGNVPVEYFDGNNIELGTKCKRSHSVLTLTILKNE